MRVEHRRGHLHLTVALNAASQPGGENANNWLCWVNPTGEKGRWNETVTATMGA